MEDMDEDFREQQHQNGDITVHRRNHEAGSHAFAPVGRVHQSDVSYFLQIYDVSRTLLYSLQQPNITAAHVQRQSE